ncbi:hypothetical protein PPERSA_07989 [Pseudocohnilembus persalinus]|uniref:Transmembrane protein n=1 Tax=Pseudocohnilembus persalinus TaxID=266149 RepID=A0A0V0QBD0_PSEPJ|nr:hypothetical protein PPERSA_07989 [Pseudocohnilembus persalinus]|eukprot:KRW99504.1 hypothetical protein PPERSA_07989 [Pseudocohnilembus persalinus]
MEYKLQYQQNDGEIFWVDEIDYDNGLQYQIQNRVQLQSDSEDPLGIILNADILIQTSGNAHSVILSETNKEQYNIYYGESTKTIPPTYEKIELPDIESVKCFDITMINETTSIVDCIQYSDPSLSNEYFCENYYYIINGNNVSHGKLNNCYLNYKPFKRKSVLHDTSKNGFTQKFLLQAVSFDWQNNQEEDLEGYLNIFRYIPDSSEDYPNGYLVPNRPLTYLDFSEDLKKLKIADFDSLGNIIYILDHTQGVIFFEYKANKVTWYKIYLPPTIIPTSRYGIAVDYQGSTVQMLIAEETKIVEYHMQTLDSEPIKKYSYPVENKIISSIQMQSSANYIIAQQGKVLSVFKRGDLQKTNQFAQILDADAFLLWYSENLYIINQQGVQNYALQKPSLQIDAVQYDNKESNTYLKIKGTSTDFSEKKECVLNIHSYILNEADSKSIHQTDYPTSQEFSYQTSLQTFIPLDPYWVGPNISYQVENMSLTRIVSFSDNTDNFFSIHVDSENNMFIYKCVPDQVQPINVDCTLKNQLVTKGSILSVSFGSWGESEQSMAIVYKDIDTRIYFYYMSEKQLGQLWFIQDINENQDQIFQIISITLQSNTLYVVAEGKKHREVKIFSKFTGDVQEMSTIDETTVQDWKMVETADQWYPQEVQVNDQQANVIFIRSSKQILIVSIESHQPKYISMIPLKTTINARHFVAPNSFVVAYANDVIQDYSLQNLDYVSGEKRFTYPIYDYEFISPFKITFSPNTGLIYVLAIESAENNQENLKCLVYKSGVSRLQTLYKVIDIENNASITGKETIDVGGDADADYLHIQYGKNKKFFARASSQRQLIVTPHILNEDIYIVQIYLMLTLIGYDGSESAVSHDVKIINSQTKIYLDEDRISQSTNQLQLYGYKKYPAYFEFDTTNWWSGSVEKFNIQCENCQETDFTLYQVVEKIDGQQETLQNIIDIKYNEHQKQIYALQENVIMYCFDVDEFALSVYKVFNNNIQKENNNKDGEQYGYQQLFIDNNFYGYQNFHNENQYYHNGVLYFISSPEGQASQFFIYSLDQDKKSEKNYAQILFQKASQYNTFVSFQILDQIPSQKSKYIKVLTVQTINEKDEDKNLITFFDFDTSQNYLPFGLKNVDFDQLILNHDLFVNDETVITYSKLVKQEYIKNSEFVHYQIIFMTSNTASYEIDFTFQLSQQEEGLSIYDESNTQIVQIFNNYGYYEAFPKIDIFKNLLITSYTSADQTILAFYNIQDEKNNVITNQDLKNNLKSKNQQKEKKNTDDNSRAKLQAFDGSYQLRKNIIDKSEQLSYIVYENNKGGYSIAYTDIRDFDQKLLFLNYYPNRLLFTLNNEIETQNLSLTLENSFSGQTNNTIQFMIDPGYPDSGSNYTVIIIICIILGVAIVLALTYWLLKKRNQVSQSYIALEGKSDAGLSLQQVEENKEN